MKRTHLVIHALTLALFAGATACQETSNGTSNGNGTTDMGPADTGETDMGETDMGEGDMGPPDMGEQGPCYLNLTAGLENGCPSGQVCNLISGECVPGKACDDQSDCDACDQNRENCGHGSHVAANCSPEHGGVCVRSKANCEPCETDADCGLMSGFLGLPSSARQIACVEYDDGKFCAHDSRNGCPKGYEPNADQRCVNPRGCGELFFCEVNDDDGDNEADENLDCSVAGLETICFDEICEGSGNLRCTGLGLPGIVEVCADYCNSDVDCLDTPSTPFCTTNTGICKSGCVPGECPRGRDEDDCDGDGDEDEMVQLTCYADGECGCPCTDDTFCQDVQAPPPEGTTTPIDTYCNLPSLPAVPVQRQNESDADFEVRAQQYLQAFPRVFKEYQDPNSCQQLGCELGPDEFINRDCPQNRACDVTQAPSPACVDGCFRGGPFVVGGDCKSSGELGSTAICADELPGNVQTKAECRNADFLGDDNREVIGACCDPGCLNRGGQCGPNRYCCEEIDVGRIEEGKFGIGPYPLGDGGACLSLRADEPASGQAQAGDCFEPRNDVFCRPCNPMQPFAACNGFELTNLVPAPGPDTPNQDMYNHAAVWPYGLNTLSEDTMAVNAGQPFAELQQCVNVEPNPMAPPQGVCAVSFDPAKGDPGAPNGWECVARTAGCLSDEDCSGLECVGEDTTAMPPVAGACKCGEGGERTSACPTNIRGLDMGESGRMRCVERKPPYLTNVRESEEGDFFCVYSYSCTPPTFQPGDGYRTFPTTCDVQERL